MVDTFELVSACNYLADMLSVCAPEEAAIFAIPLNNFIDAITPYELPPIGPVRILSHVFSRRQAHGIALHGSPLDGALGVLAIVVSSYGNKERPDINGLYCAIALYRSRLTVS